MRTGKAPPRWRGVRARTTVIVVSATAVVSLLALLLLSWLADRQLEAALDEGLQTRISDAASSVRLGEPLLDPFAQVVDRKGRVVLSSPGMDDVDLLRGAQLRRALTQELTFERRVPLLGGEVRALARPVDGTAVVVASRTSDLDAASDRLRLLLAAMLAALVAVSGVVSWALVGSTLRPVHAMTQTARRIGSTSREQRLPDPRSGDEIAELAAALNEMLERQAAALQRERAFVDDASHELRTPLTLLRGELELAATDEKPEQTRAGVQRALQAAERLSSLAENLLVLARTDGGMDHHPQRFMLDTWLSGVAVRLGHLPLRVEVDVPPGAEVTADPNSLERVVGNLASNAVAAGATRVRVTARANSREPGGVDLLVEDDGPGFPPDFVARALDRFSRGDPSRTGSGAGLGLAIVDAVARAHHGSVTLGESPGLGGAQVTVSLPDGSHDRETG